MVTAVERQVKAIYHAVLNKKHNLGYLLQVGI
jgi:hypothetical protein